MKKTLFLLSAAVLIFSATAFAQRPGEDRVNQERRAAGTAAGQYRQEAMHKLMEEWKNLTPEQRKARKDEFKNRRAELKAKASDRIKENKGNLTPEKRAKIKERAENLTPEQRDRLKERMKEHRKTPQSQTGRPAKPNRKV